MHKEYKGVCWQYLVYEWSDRLSLQHPLLRWHLSKGAQKKKKSQRVCTMGLMEASDRACSGSIVLCFGEWANQVSSLLATWRCLTVRCRCRRALIKPRWQDKRYYTHSGSGILAVKVEDVAGRRGGVARLSLTLFFSSDKEHYDVTIRSINRSYFN